MFPLYTWEFQDNWNRPLGHSLAPTLVCLLAHLDFPGKNPMESQRLLVQLTGGGTDAGGAESAESPDFSDAPADGGVDVEGG